MIEARFDDLTAGGASFRLVGTSDVLQAQSLDEVASVLDGAQAAAASGKWVAGFVAYEAAPALDPALVVRARGSSDPLAELPLAWFGAFDHREPTSLPEPKDEEPAEDAEWSPSIDRAEYQRAIAAIRDRIAAGDTYQINFTFRLRSPFGGDPRGLYRDLCFAQRGAHAAYLDLGRYRILSASPELFVQIRNGVVTTRPMKGTAPRGRWPDEDRAIEERLRASAKDRAENAMIVDLVRNDLGRVATAGSVRWDDVFSAERYETVWQLTTTVEAELRDGASLTDVFRSLFPSGSVTGAPKVRSMELIASLEDSPRGAYCGAVGFLVPGPSLDARFNVAIRTVVLDDATRTAEYGVGGGITWGSSAASEYEEALAKARVLITRRPRFDLVETLRYDPDEGYAHLDAHLRRLRASAEHFGFAFDEHEIRSALARDVAGSEGSLRVRLLLDRRGRPVVRSAPLPTSAAPVRLALATDHPVDPADPMLFHKTSLRERYEAARERHPDADDVILVNTNGELTETTIANLCVHLEGRWWTPPLAAGLLPGVEREALLASGAIAERSMTPADLAASDGIAVVSSVRGWREAELIGSPRDAERVSGGT